MKKLKLAVASLLVLTYLGAPVAALAAESTGKSKAKAYPLATCVVSDEKLGEMGEPYVIKHEGREVRLCCKSCLKDFKKTPAKFMKKLDAAEKAAAK